MSSKKKAALLGLMAAAMASEEKNDYLKFENPYADLPEPYIDGSDTPRTYKKTQLTNKQKKKRATAKRAKKARKKHR
jgi:hypothetical protein